MPTVLLFALAILALILIPVAPTMVGVGALIQRGGRAVAGMLTIATAGGS